MDSFNSYKIGKLGKVITGKTPKTSHPDFYGGSYMFITPGELHQGYEITESEKTLTDEGFNSIRANTISGESVLVGCIGSDMGNVAFCKATCATNQQINAVTEIIEDVNPLYLYYWLCDKKYYLRSIAGITTAPILSKSDFEEINVLFPCKQAQDRAVNLLSLIDDKIVNNKRTIKELEEIARLIYDYWFTQYNFPDENGKPYRSSGGKMVWNNELKREIPEDWDVKPFLDIASWETNSQPPKSEFVYKPKAGYVRFIQNRDYDSSEHITYVPENANHTVATRLDILIDKYGDAGRVRYGLEGVFNVALGMIKPFDSNMQEYIRSYLESKGIYLYLHNACMASTRASLSESNLSFLNIVIPPHLLLLRYQDMLSKIRDFILKLMDENGEISSLRDWLLPMLMNGQVKVS